MRAWKSVSAVLLLCAGWSGTASAQNVSGSPVPIPPPPGGPPAVVQPGLGAWVVRDANNFDAGFLSYDFHFSDMVNGWGFKPGEHVTITPEHVDASPVATTANEEGFFSVRISFLWRFCGAGATSSAAPDFIAAGDEGTTAQTSQPAPDCPTLVAIARPQPIDSGTSTSGTGNASGGSVATSPPVVAGPPAGPISPEPPVDPPVPAPGPVRPVTLTFDLQGFGFQAGEGVTVHALNLGGDNTAEPVHARADADGRFQSAMTLTLQCTGGQAWPTLEAEGDRGTTISAALACWQWYGCQPPRMCPVPAPMPDPVPPVAQPDAPAVPAAGSSSAQLAGVSASIHLGKSQVRRGGRQSAVIRIVSTSTVSLTLYYPGGRVSTLRQSTAGSVRAGEHQSTFRWTVPKKVRPGTVRVRVDLQSEGQILQTQFRVR